MTRFALSCLLFLTGCGVSTAELETDDTLIDGEGVYDDAAEDIGTLTQGVTSTQPYYHWSNRSDHHAAAYEACSPNLLKVLAYMKARWGGQSLGCHGNRYVKGQGGSTTWSTHAWGAALDFTATGGWATNFGPLADFLIAHSEELGINALHDYRRVAHSDGTVRGRIWKPLIGWRPANIGDPGTWIHIEVRPDRYTDGRTVEDRVNGGGAVGADGCTAKRRAEAAAYGCACVDGQPNGGWCPGTGCSEGQRQACSNYGAGCVDGQCKGIFAPGYACTQYEFKSCGAYLSGCTNHQCLAGRVGGDDGRNCDELTITNCSRYGCGCKNNQCSDGSCPIIP